MTTTTSTTVPATVRKRQTSVSSFLVHCICITAAFLVTGCGLVGLGLTCILLKVVDDTVASCPHHLIVTVFSVAGGLFILSFGFFIHLCSRNKRLKREALLVDLPNKEDVALYKKKLSAAGIEEVVMPSASNGSGGVGEKSDDKDTNPAEPLDNGSEVNNFASAQKSADVSYWIEQQKPDNNEVSENFPMDSTDGDTTNEEKVISDSEITVL